MLLIELLGVNEIRYHLNQIKSKWAERMSGMNWSKCKGPEVKAMRKFGV